MMRITQAVKATLETKAIIVDSEQLSFYKGAVSDGYNFRQFV